MPRGFRWAKEGEIPPHVEYAAIVNSGKTIRYSSRAATGIIQLVEHNGRIWCRFTCGRNEEFHSDAYTACWLVYNRYAPLEIEIIEGDEL